jgi:hypothetical protein
LRHPSLRYNYAAINYCRRVIQPHLISEKSQSVLDLQNRLITINNKAIHPQSMATRRVGEG